MLLIHQRRTAMNMAPTNDEFSASVPDSASDPPISALNFPTYICTLIENAGYQNVGALVLQMETDREAILAIKGIGPKTLELIEAAIENYVSPSVVDQSTTAKEATGVNQASETKAEPEAKKDMKKKDKKKKKDKSKEKDAISKKKIKKGKTKKKETKSKKEKKGKKKDSKPKKEKAKKKRNKKSKEKGAKDKKKRGKKAKKKD